MSFDFAMLADVGGEKPIPLEGFEANYTYNVSNMFYEILPNEGIREIDGKNRAQCKPILEKILKAFDENPQKFIAMEPENKWGSFEGAKKLIQNLLSWCEQAPNAIMEIS